MSTYLQHHGVLGQKWGKRNGPPYPLDAQGMMALKAQRRREKILKNPKKLRKYRDEFTEEEIQQALKDFKLDQQLKDIPAQDINRGANVIKVSSEALAKSVAGLLAIAGLYNVVGIALNTYLGTNLPVIDIKKAKGT